MLSQNCGIAASGRPVQAMNLGQQKGAHLIGEASQVTAAASDTSSVQDPRNSLGNELSQDDTGHTHKLRESAAERRRKKSAKTADLAAEVRGEDDQQDTDALRGYEAFYHLPPGSASLRQVHNSSAGIDGLVLIRESDGCG